MTHRRQVAEWLRSQIRRSPRLTRRLVVIRAAAFRGREGLRSLPHWDRVSLTRVVGMRIVRSGRDLEADYEAVRGLPDAGAEYERVLRRVYEAVLQPGDTTFDIGAHVGKHTLPMAMAVGPAGRVVAAEPIAWAVERLERRVSEAGLDDVVAIRNVCVGSQPGTVTFNIVNDRPGLSSVHLRDGLQNVTEVKIEQLALSRLVAEYGAPRFVKIDVEGAEFDVLKGGRHLLEAHQPILHLEIVPRALNAFSRNVIEINRLLVPLGYRLFDLIGTDVTNEEQWTRSAGLPAPCDYLAIHRNDPCLSMIRRELRRSLIRPRVDTSRHAKVDVRAPDRAGADSQRELAMVPTTPTDVAEAVDVARLLEAAGLNVVVALDPGLANSIWPQALRQVRWESLERVSANTYVVFAPHDSAALPIARAIGKESVVLRTSGVEPMRVGIDGAARRYRGYRKVLLRSKLEVAELGDRNFELIPVRRVTADVADGVPQIIVVLPTIAGRIDVAAWVQEVVATASVAAECVVASLSPNVGHGSGFDVAALDLGLLRRACLVILPLCDELGLVEAAGIDAVIYDATIRSSDWSKPWLSGVRIARDKGQLREAVRNGTRYASTEYQRFISRFRMISVDEDMTSSAKRWIAAVSVAAPGRAD